MTILLKRAYEDAAEDDGQRVLVDRLWPRGVSRERAQLALWLKEIAPSTELRKWFAHDPAKWQEFQARYKQELDDNADVVQRLVAMVKAGKVTLVYGGRDTAHKDAVVLKAYLEAVIGDQ